MTDTARSEGFVRGGVVRRVLARLARAAPARVFVVEGLAPPAPPALLGLSRAVHIVESPRSATILLVAGHVPRSLSEVVRRVHDAMGAPRCTLVWRRDGDERAEDLGDPWPRMRSAGGISEVAACLSHAQAELVTGRLPSEPPLLPDVEPAEWRGVGPYGQGGTGMTGGVPYGRPLTETAPDRDGLRLDQLDVRIGPFFPPFPTGLELSVSLQGDVIQQLSVGDNPFAGARGDDIFRRALALPVPLAELEMARARHHLRWVAQALRVHGLTELGRRALGLSEALTPGAAAPIAALGRAIQRSRIRGVSNGSVGVIGAETVRGAGLGPVARASGLEEDARSGDEVYQPLGFEPLTQSGGDAGARLLQRLAEAEQSVTLALRAGDAVTRPSGRVESPAGTLTHSTSPLSGQLRLVPPLLTGMEWGDAVTTLVSLDVDLRDLPPASSTALESDGA